VSWIKRIQSVFRRGKLERELDDELRHHIELKTRDDIEAGVSPEEARYAAFRAFGGAEQKREACRDADRLRWVGDLIQDLRYGWRQLRRNPGFTAAAIITLALGIGANTAIFSAIETVLVHPYSFPDPARLVLVCSSNLRTHTYDQVSGPDYLDWKSQNDVFERIAAYSFRQPADLAIATHHDRVWSIVASSNLLRTLGIRPPMGRTFLSGDGSEGSRALLLSYRLWQSRFGGRRDALGRTVRVNGQGYEIVGVLPPQLDLPGEGGMPVGVVLPTTDNATLMHNRGARLFYVIARLKLGRSLDAAQSEMSVIVRRLAVAHPVSDGKRTAHVMPINAGREFLRDPLWALFGAAAFVLLIACANLSSLLLERGLVRQKEFAIRAAMGAPRLRLSRQIFTESVILAWCGGAFGLIAAWEGTRLLGLFGSVTIPALRDLRLSGGAVVFAVGLSFATAAIFGVLPTWKVLDLDVNRCLKEAAPSATEGFRSFRFRRVVVGLQVGLAFLVLSGAGLLLRSFYDLVRTDPGFQLGHLVSAEVAKSGSPAAQIIFFGHLVDHLAAIRGVTGVAAASALPLGSDAIAPMPPFEVPGQAAPASPPSAMLRVVTPGYFRVMGIRMLAGREFTHDDDPSSPRVAVINDAVARRYFAGRSALGEEIALLPVRYVAPFASAPGVLRIVGVIPAVKHWFTGGEPHVDFEIYLPYAQSPVGTMTLVARLDGHTPGAASQLQHRLDALAPGEVIQSPEAMEQLFSSTVAPNRFYPLLLTLFAVLALALASIGIYGTLAYLVRERTHEIGIRAALGASRADILRLIIGQGLRPVLVGAAAGFVAAVELTQLLSGLLFGIHPNDPATLAGVATLLIAVGLSACYIPARRATRVDPMVALRYE
jgi:predicted permease